MGKGMILPNLSFGVSDHVLLSDLCKVCVCTEINVTAMIADKNMISGQFNLDKYSIYSIHWCKVNLYKQCIFADCFT